SKRIKYNACDPQRRDVFQKIHCNRKNRFDLLIVAVFGIMETIVVALLQQQEMGSPPFHGIDSDWGGYTVVQSLILTGYNAGAVECRQEWMDTVLVRMDNRGQDERQRHL
ncbi:MAG: hypothetical protein K2G13_05145, partial [Muribaculaceae bacterium]|nr:hypothetical protein [Muribaculaceae bacterium]